MRKQLRLTGGKKTLDYSIQWISLHGAHIIGCEECAATSSRQTLAVIARERRTDKFA